jgi:hypothetical protein
MKSLCISIVACSGLWNRIFALLADSPLMHEDFKIYSYEDESYHDRYIASVDIHSRLWMDYLLVIGYGLRNNVNRIPGPVKQLLRSNCAGASDLYTQPWMQPRTLNYGDLSVMSKHFRAMDDFLSTNLDYLMVLEDDAILNESSISRCRLLVQEVCFDYLDIGGGDGIECSTLQEEIGGFNLEKIFTRATRTACAYIVSRRAAECIARVLVDPVMPVDWSISYALQMLPTDAEVYWSCDSLVLHGSSIGNVRSWRVLK